MPSSGDQETDTAKQPLWAQALPSKNVAITGLLLVGSVTYGVLTSGGGEAREAAAPMLKGGANLELEMPGF